MVNAPNVRGSTGYGMEFQRANIKDLGGADLKDEVAGVEFLKATGFIDPKRAGIWGGPYGGFMTLMAIGKTPTLSEPVHWPGPRRKGAAVLCRAARRWAACAGGGQHPG